MISTFFYPPFVPSFLFSSCVSHVSCPTSLLCYIKQLILASMFRRGPRLSGCSSPPPNLNTALGAIEAAGFHVVNVGARDVIDGKQRAFWDWDCRGGYFGYTSGRKRTSRYVETRENKRNGKCITRS